MYKRQELLRQNYKLKDIARAINVSPSTISREIKNRRLGTEKLEICLKTNRYPVAYTHLDVYKRQPSWALTIVS